MIESTGGALAPMEDANSMPSMSLALRKWLEENAVAPRGADAKSLTLKGNKDEVVAELAADYDRCEQAGLAFRVRQGFRLLQIQAIDETSFEQVIRDRSVTRAVAQRDMDLVRLFNALPHLPLLRRAEELGVARIRELKPHFGLDGLRQLIEGEKVDTLTYDAAIKMSKRDIVAWRKARFQAQLELGVAQSGVEVPDVEHTPVKPRALEAATDELLGAVSRAWHEVERAKRVVRDLLPPGTDEWQAARTELAHAAHLVIRGIADQTGALDDLLVKRFGVTVTRPHEGEYHTLAPSRLLEINNLTEEQADADTNARAKQRHARLKWRGAPPKTLDAVIANARNGDRE